ncbi:hypothetical protein BS47DRAFT_1339049 [Hydnum rufescens UP504]|uniref:Uncharacterized protein n=1 Tax=Hydnum rufescens UP504 TaxID=1448309 RepID=A0A9P6E0H5_9AGAM|nr:hypothetical protein BS47DRAFT_1339049 [Hydnum rufescens UP504]
MNSGLTKQTKLLIDTFINSLNVSPSLKVNQHTQARVEDDIPTPSTSSKWKRSEHP